MKNNELAYTLLETAIRQKLFVSTKDAITAITGAIKISKKLLKRRNPGIKEFIEYEAYLIEKNYRPDEMRFLYSIPCELLKLESGSNPFKKLCCEASRPATFTLDDLRRFKAKVLEMLPSLLEQIDGIQQPDKKASILLKLYKALEKVPDKVETQESSWVAVLPFILSEDADMVDGTIPLAEGKKIVKIEVPL
jgi:hypothetical protein